jgi:hypothetical protein
MFAEQQINSAVKLIFVNGLVRWALNNVLNPSIVNEGMPAIRPLDPGGKVYKNLLRYWLGAV